jgi:glutaredoxin 3
MVKVQVYTKKVCPYCVRAKALLTSKGVTFEEIDVENDDAKRLWLVEVTGQRTVPQVFAGGQPLGGFDDITALDRQGKLDPILRGEAKAPALA